jgi:hypothetical protein
MEERRDQRASAGEGPDGPKLPQVEQGLRLLVRTENTQGPGMVDAAKNELTNWTYCHAVRLGPSTRRPVIDHRAFAVPIAPTAPV